MLNAFSHRRRGHGMQRPAGVEQDGPFGGGSVFVLTNVTIQGVADGMQQDPKRLKCEAHFISNMYTYILERKG